MKWMLVGALYYWCWFFTWGAFLADIEAMAPLGRDWCAHDRAAFIGIALLPPAWPMALFMTGFYQHGFKWSCS